MTTLKEVEESWARMVAAEAEHEKLREDYTQEHAPYKLGEWGARSTNPIIPFTSKRHSYGAADREISQRMRVMHLKLVRHHRTGKWMWLLTGNIVRKDGTDGIRRDLVYELVKEDL